MIASVIDLAERRRFERGPELALDERLGSFERLLADLSATFSNVPSEQVDGVIPLAQRRIVDALDLDRSTLWVAEDGDLVHNHDWTQPEIRTREWCPPASEDLRAGALPVESRENERRRTGSILER